MKKIQMVDLKGQYQDIKDKVDSSIQSVIDSASFINGPKVKEFQLNLENYLNIKHVIPCANGTDALQIAMMGLGLKAGDEVITADFTFAATVEVIALLGLTPVLVDVDPNSFNIDIESIKNDGILTDIEDYITNFEEKLEQTGKLADKASKVVKGVKGLAKKYNSLADLCGLPHVPSILLGEN